MYLHANNRQKKCEHMCVHMHLFSEWGKMSTIYHRAIDASTFRKKFDYYTSGICCFLSKLVRLATSDAFYHYNDIIMSAMASQTTSLAIFTQPLIQAQIKENFKAPRHWLLWGEFTNNRCIPHTKGQKRGKYFHMMASSCFDKQQQRI